MHVLGLEATLSFARHPTTNIISIDCADSFIADEIESHMIDTTKTYFAAFDPVEISKLFHQRDLFDEPTNAQCIVIDGGSAIRSKEDLKQLDHILNLVPVNSKLILRGASESVRKLFEARGALLHVEQMKPWDKAPFVEKWIASQMQGRGIVFESIVPKKLYEIVGADRTALLSEIDKIDIWRMQSEMCKWSDIQTLVGGAVSSTMSQLTQAILTSDKKQIVKHYRELENQGVHELAQLKYLSQVFLKKVKEAPGFSALLAKIEERSCAIRTGEDGSALHQELFLLSLLIT